MTLREDRRTGGPDAAELDRPAMCGAVPAVKETGNGRSGRPDPSPANAPRATRDRARRTLAHAILGFVSGYALLHPMSMVVFRVLAPEAPHFVGHSPGHPVLGPIAHSFTIGMLPMGLAFAALVAVVAAANGYQRASLALQRDELRRRAGLLASRNMRLAILERANRRTTRFMVHDFKNHLGSILGFVDLLRMKSELRSVPDIHDALFRIRRGGLRMLEAVRDLLEVSNREAGTAPTHERVAPRDLIEGIAGVAIAGVAGGLTLGPGLRTCPAVMADVPLIRRVLTNLVVNAWKHNPAGTRVTLDATPDPDGAEVVFTCTDDGEGVPAELLPSIFREGTGAGDSGDSHGLGLAFCRDAVRAHGGRIWHERPDGPGARLCFTLQAAREDSHG